ncbi:MAG: tRNA preQ1(34) S-adenosylmethionine ribosyltransferase-isomerase QueA [Candidatus Zixiibacteriota bacterium]|nr:MAG: tRNA preQ1(34) S-adenosylmethionine ribosyltransferase-isomerase QueA [candidate division Zixibacteria bacterium]
MDINLFDYHLPPELIAQHPAAGRDESRLMVLNRATGRIEIHPFADFASYPGSGDVLVINNTRVFKARLLGNRATGGRVEVFLVRRAQDDPLVWQAMVRPSRRVKKGERVFFGQTDEAGEVSLTLEEDRGGQWLVRFDSAESREKIIDDYGHVPLPQYIKRPDIPEDIERYQTIFARPDRTGAVAAPTAGFHFTPRLLKQLRDKGVIDTQLTLHVGPGTFKPVQVDDIEEHTVDPEFAELSPEAAETINGVRRSGGRIFVVGTTSVRTLESAAMKNGDIVPFAGDVDLYIRPGHEFRFVDHLLTNFHLPKSSLLILVSAFAGRELILEAYRRAIENRFRFYSYGDAMLIL